MKNVLLVCAFLLSVLITVDLFLKEPPVWPDEAGLAQFSISIKQDPLNYFKYYPSVYILLLSQWFRIFELSIISQRLLSIVGGIFTVTAFVYILKRINSGNNTFEIIGLILLLTDFTFLQGARVGRPEIWTLCFGLISVYFLFNWIKSNFNKYRFLFFSITACILAVSFHLNGFIFLLPILVTVSIFFKRMFNKMNRIVLLSAAALMFPFLVWFTVLLKSTLGFILLRLRISNAQETWLFEVFSSKPIELRLIYTFYLLTSIIFLIFCLRKRERYLLSIILPLLLSWLVLIINKDFWYAVYLVPLVIISFIILSKDIYKSWKVTKSLYTSLQLFGLTAMCIVFFLSNLMFHLNILLSEGGSKFSYERYISDIQKVIPDNKTVFNSAIPSTYYAFTKRGNNKYLNFPQSFVEKNDSIKVLNGVDYIIFNGTYGDNYYGDLVAKYIEKNQVNIIKIGEQDQYHVYIVELKPTEQRTNP